MASPGLLSRRDELGCAGCDALHRRTHGTRCVRHARGGGEGRLMPSQRGGEMVRGGQRLLQAPPSPSSGIPPLRGWREYLHLPIAFCHSVRRLGKSISARSHSRRSCCSLLSSALSFLAKFSEALPQSALNRELVCRPQSRGALGELLWRIAIRPGLSGRPWKSCMNLPGLMYRRSVPGMIGTSLRRHAFASRTST